MKKTVLTLNNQKGIKPVVVLDEVQELPVSTLSGLKALLNYSMDSSNYLFLLLCGQAEFKSTIQLEQLDSLHRRIRVSYSPGALSLEEIPKYIRHQMENAGVKKQIFSDEAIAKMFEYSKGNISKINRLAFNALICASSNSQEIIDTSTIEVASGI